MPLDVTAIPLSLIPLAFASAIVQYRLRDVEVIVKRGLVYTAVVFAMVAIYLVLEQLALAMFLDEPDGHSSIIALLATAVVVLLARPVKDAIESMLDRGPLPRPVRLPAGASRLRARAEQRFSTWAASPSAW